MDMQKNYMVSIGASAGGLQSFLEFFKSLPDETGIIFTVISHLYRDYKSQLTSILEKHSRLPVLWMENNQVLKPDHIYVLPENKVAMINERTINLYSRKEDEKLNKSIDTFFSSMSVSYGDKAIGIILSGTGSDGLQGAKEIERRGGVVIVQDPLTAQFNGMPLTAISLDSPDYILKPKDMPRTILNIVASREDNYQESAGN